MGGLVGNSALEEVEGVDEDPADAEQFSSSSSSEDGAGIRICTEFWSKGLGTGVAIDLG